MALIFISIAIYLLKKFVLSNKNTVDGNQLLSTYIRLEMAKTYPRLVKNKIYVSKEFNEAVTNFLIREV